MNANLSQATNNENGQKIIIHQQIEMFATAGPLTRDDYIQHASGYGLTGAAWELWKYLSGYFADPEKNECFPSMRRMSEKLGCVIRTVRRAVAKLVELGLLIREQRQRKNGSDTSNIYRPVGIQENTHENTESPCEAHSRWEDIDNQDDSVSAKKGVCDTSISSPAAPSDTPMEAIIDPSESLDFPNDARPNVRPLNTLYINKQNPKDNKPRRERSTPAKARVAAISKSITQKNSDHSPEDRPLPIEARERKAEQAYAWLLAQKLNQAATDIASNVIDRYWTTGANSAGMPIRSILGFVKGVLSNLDNNPYQRQANAMDYHRETPSNAVPERLAITIDEAEIPF